MKLSSCGVTVVVPTYKEAKNIPELVARIQSQSSLVGPIELIIVDDDSRDGTVEEVNKLGSWAKVIVRSEEKGLSSAVIAGLKEATMPFFVVMDADLSHPPEKIPELIKAIADEGYDFSIGSRYVEGGSVYSDWTFFRHINSMFATLLVLPLVNIKDPMSGFFALSREKFNTASRLNPIGYKIGLELFVKCHCKNVKEVPIFFGPRKHGESKLSLKQQLLFLVHVVRLYWYKGMRF